MLKKGAFPQSPAGRFFPEKRNKIRLSTKETFVAQTILCTLRHFFVQCGGL
jgi:hypothetical protein